MTIPVVTIGIPTYNYGRYVGQAIASALAQEEADVEVLVSDNSSTDHTRSVLDGFKDRRLRWWQNDRNLGVYPNWDILLREARGEYFKILQADDWLEPRYVVSCLEAIEAEKADVCLAGYRNTGNLTGEVLPQDFGLQGSHVGLDRSAVGRCLWSLSQFVQPTFGLYRRNLVPEGYGGGSSNLSRDMVFWARALVRGRLVLVNKVLAVQRIHDAQDRRRKDTSMGIGDILDALEILRDLGPEAQEPIEAMSRLFSASFARSGFRHLLGMRTGAALRVVRHLARHERLGRAFADLLSGSPMRALGYEEFLQKAKARR